MARRPSAPFRPGPTVHAPFPFCIRPAAASPARPSKGTPRFSAWEGDSATDRRQRVRAPLRLPSGAKRHYPRAHRDAPSRGRTGGRGSTARGVSRATTSRRAASVYTGRVKDLERNGARSAQPADQAALGNVRVITQILPGKQSLMLATHSPNYNAAPKP